MFFCRVLATLWIMGISCTGIMARYPKPFIESADEYILEANSDHNIICKTRAKPEWSYPSRNGLKSMSHITSTVEKLDTDVDFKYKAVLMINNASFMDTGYFYCHEADVSYDDENKSSKVYLYVNDSEHLWVDDESFAIQASVKFSKVILPCRPTSPNIRVELFRNADEYVPAPFDSKIGFTLYSPKLNDTDGYYCQFTRPNSNESDQKHMYLSVIPSTSVINSPELEDMSMGHTIVGQNLSLNCSLQLVNIPFNFSWKIPHPEGLSNPRIKENTIPLHGGHYSILTIENATKRDEGYYTCIVNDYNLNSNNISLRVPVYNIDEHFITITEENNLDLEPEISESAGKSIYLTVDINAHPLDHLKLKWFHNVNTQSKLIAEWEYNNTQGRINIDPLKYDVKFTPVESSIEIKNSQILDYGNYTIKATNHYTKAETSFNIAVHDKPTIQLSLPRFNMLNNITKIECVAAGYPIPQIHWSLQCLEDNCGLTEDHKSQFVKGLHVHSILSVSARGSGIVQCHANNTIGDDTVIKPFNVSDVKNGFDLYVSKNLLPKTDGVFRVPEDEYAELHCQVSLFVYNNDFTWYHNDVEISYKDSFSLTRSSTKYSYKSSLMIKPPKSGIFKCIVSRKQNLNSIKIKEKKVELVIAPLQAPIITNTSLVDVLSMEFPDPLRMTCYVEGVPRPTIKWLHNDMPIVLDNRTEMLEDGQVLIFKKTFVGDEGLYSCLVYNRVGEYRKDMKAIFRNKPYSAVILITAICVLIILVMLVGLWAVKQGHKNKKYKKKLENMGFSKFDEGDVTKINPELGLAEQAVWLPYDKARWEIPFEKLKLGKQLGAGAFGVVLKAEARGISGSDDVTIVAVKTVKPDADIMHLRALSTELKIMGQIGRHLNVLNLLGACTRNLVKKQLYVIVEYCRYGNLQSYLFKHRRYFVNQIDKDTGKFDFTIRGEHNRTFSFSSSRRGSDELPEYGGSNCTGQTQRTETTILSMSPTGEDTITSNNSSDGPGWRLNYRGDYDDHNLVHTQDLLAWAFQVARGMEYLVSRKVLHRDLAARNILLSEQNVVKICDFGLAKETLEYEKKGDTPLPIKWMAVESIQDKIFSTQSDVWAYGIVLWEFFSLAKSPYPGMAIDDNFLIKIINGYRMEIPQYATNEVYKIMLECWQQDPTMRPNFSDLVQRVGAILNENDKQHYIDLNDPYLVPNNHFNQTDEYLAMFGSPDFEHIIATPKYMNDGQALTLNNEGGGYMCMKQPNIFSPRPADYQGTIFNYDGKGVELQPMLKSTQQHESVSDVESLQSPSPSMDMNSVSNPSYLHFPYNPHTYQNIAPSDNYISMNQKKLLDLQLAEKGDELKLNKVPAINEDVFDNECENEQEAPYANSSTRDWGRLAAQR